MIIGITGGQGSGKTAIMSLFLLLYFKSKKTIFSNYNLTFNHIQVTDDLFKNKDSLLESIESNNDAKGVCFGIDEIHLILDSRGAMANRKKSFILTQARKVLEENGVFFYTTQFFNQIDLRLRFNTQYVLKAEKFKFKNVTKFKVAIWKNDGEYLRNTHKSFWVNGNLIFKLNLYEKYELIETL